MSKFVLCLLLFPNVFLYSLDIDELGFYETEYECVLSAYNDGEVLIQLEFSCLLSRDFDDAYFEITGIKFLSCADIMGKNYTAELRQALLNIVGERLSFPDKSGLTTLSSFNIKDTFSATRAYFQNNYKPKLSAGAGLLITTLLDILSAQVASVIQLGDFYEPGEFAVSYGELISTVSELCDILGNKNGPKYEFETIINNDMNIQYRKSVLYQKGEVYSTFWIKKL